MRASGPRPPGVWLRAGGRLAIWALGWWPLAPAWAAQEQDVQLQLDLAAPLKAEKDLKALLDEWTTGAFDIQFTPRPEFDPSLAGFVRVRLEGLRVAFNPDWYKRYKTFHDELIKQPFGPAALRRGLEYARQGDGRLDATLVDAGGKVLLATKVWNSRAPSHFQPVEGQLFSAEFLRPLPETPVSLAQLWELPAGETPYLSVPVKLVANVKKIRLGDMATRRWPIDLSDPLAPTPPKPPAGAPAPKGSGQPAPPAVPGAPPAPAAPPGGSAPQLNPPRL
ncbi:MAG: hypothetical protein VKP62_11325 [Candidatus Sericytochromatia bacterium]|nr:hypothetical protein [Candidatus Sericytochromatia bacterium]